MTKKRYLFMILAAGILLTSVLAAGCTDPSSGGGSGTGGISGAGGGFTPFWPWSPA